MFIVIIYYGGKIIKYYLKCLSKDILVVFMS